MGKKVKVVTKCGEEHTYTYNQDVATVEIIELEYTQQDTLQQLIDIYNEGCSGSTCKTCALQILPHDCTLCDIMASAEKAQGYDKIQSYKEKGEQ